MARFGASADEVRTHFHNVLQIANPRYLLEFFIIRRMICKMAISPDYGDKGTYKGDRSWLGGIGEEG